MKELENEKINILNKKFKYHENKKHVSHAILIIKKLELKYNKLQLITTVRLKTSN